MWHVSQALQDVRGVEHVCLYSLETLVCCDHEVANVPGSFTHANLMLKQLEQNSSCKGKHAEQPAHRQQPCKCCFSP